MERDMIEFDFSPGFSMLIDCMEKEAKDISADIIDKYIVVLDDAETEAEYLLEKISRAKETLEEIVEKQKTPEPLKPEALSEAFLSSIDDLLYL